MQAYLVEYGQHDSPLHRMDPRWKLAAIALAVAAILPLRTIPAAATTLGGSLALLTLSDLPWRWLASRLGGVAAFIALFVVILPLTLPGEDWQIGPIGVSAYGLMVACVIALKALAVVALTLLLLATAPLETTLQAAHALHVPSLFIQLLLLTYRYVYLFADELGKLRIALRLRAYRNRANAHCYRTIAHVTGTLLVRCYERAERVSHAMRCRGFDGRFRSLHSFRTRPADLGLAALLLALTAGVSWVMEIAWM